MADEIELIRDGDNLAVIGDPAAVERFLSSAGVASKDLDLHRRLGAALNAGSGAVQAGSEIAANAGRWVKLTEESAKAMKVSELMKGSSSGVSRAVLTEKGKIKGILEFAKTPGSMLTNPAMLAGAAGIMAQLAMQQAMDEITDYLAVIDEKVDDILQAQKNAALAQMIGAGQMIDDALVRRKSVGRVSDVTWSQVQAAPQTVATTQAYALLQLDALAEKLEKKSKVGDLAKASQDAEVQVEEWLAVLARCFQLQDGLAVLELDRVLDASPADLDQHRLAIQESRENRMELITRSTERLMARMDAAASKANEKVLLHPFKSGAVVKSSNQVAIDVTKFHGGLGIEVDHDLLESKRWMEAASDARAGAVEAGVAGVAAVGRFGADTAQNAKRAGAKVSSALAKVAPWVHQDGTKPDGDA